MCYDIKINLEAQLSRAKRKGDLQVIEEIKEKQTPITDLSIHQIQLPIPHNKSFYLPFACQWEALIFID